MVEDGWMVEFCRIAGYNLMVGAGLMVGYDFVVEAGRMVGYGCMVETGRIVGYDLIVWDCWWGWKHYLFLILMPF
jgi:hypothetical protein